MDIPMLTEMVLAAQIGKWAIKTNVLRMLRSTRLLKEPMHRNLIFLYSQSFLIIISFDYYSTKAGDMKIGIAILTYSKVFFY